MLGKHIELFLVDGDFGGIVTADVSGWTGHILTGPRTSLPDILRREDVKTNGVYLLLGDDLEAYESTRCYIGRTEDFSQRIYTHDRSKEWWNRLVFISSREESFNEGHWGYLESRLVEIAQRARRCTLTDNKQQPQPRKLSEAQSSDAENFLSQVRSILPVLGVSILRSTAQDDVLSQQLLPQPPSPTFTLVLPKRGVNAQGRVIDGEFVMLTGSRVVGQWTRDTDRFSPATRRAYQGYQQRYDKLVADGSIAVDGTVGVLTRDIPFSSPSTAGSIATGRSCNGRASWMWEGGTYADWEERGLPEMSSEDPR